MPCLRQNRALIDQRGAEGPDALQVSIKVPIALNDLEGCGPSQPRNPIKAHHWTHALLRQNRALIDQRGVEGPDALQVSIKVPLVLQDLEGCGPSWRAAVPCSRGTNKDPPSGPRLGAPDKARIDQRGAEGPDALHVLLKAPMDIRSNVGKCRNIVEN